MKFFLFPNWVCPLLTTTRLQRFRLAEELFDYYKESLKNKIRDLKSGSLRFYHQPTNSVKLLQTNRMNIKKNGCGVYRCKC